MTFESELNSYLKIAPSEDDLNQYLSNKYPTQEPSIKNKLARGLSDFVKQYKIGAETTERDLDRLVGFDPKERRTPDITPTSALSTGARIAGEYTAPVPQFGPISLVGGPLVKGALMTRKGYPTAVKALSKLKGGINVLKKPLTEGLSAVGSTLTSIPVDQYKRALKRNIFKGKTDDKAFQEVGGKAQEALNHLSREASKVVRVADDMLEKIPARIDTTDYLKKLKGEAKRFNRGRVDLLSKSDKGMLGEIYRVLRPAPKNVTALAKKGQVLGGKNPSIVDVQDLKKKLDDYVKWDNSGLDKASSRAEPFFKEISNDLRKTVAQVSDDLAKANEVSHKMQNLKNELKTTLKTTNMGKRLQNLDKQNQVVKEGLEHLDEIAPKELKFLGQTKDMIAAKSFDQLFPGKGGGSGSDQGYANLLRIMIGGFTPPLIPLMSPQVQKGLIRGARGGAGIASTAFKRSGPLLQKAIPREVLHQAPKVNPDGSLTPERVLEIRRERNLINGNT